MPSGSTGVKFELPCVGIEPGRRLAAMSIRVREPGLAGVTSALHSSVAEAGIRILGFACSADGGEFLCVGLGDYTDASTSPAEVAAALAAIPGCEDVKIYEGPMEGFAAVRGLIPEMADARTVLMSMRTLAGLLQGPREYLGDDAGAAFVYYEGFFAGRATGEYFSRFGRERALAMLPSVWEARGYGTPIEVLSDPGGGRYRFEVGHLIECEVLSKYVTGRARTSNFFRGMIAGALSTIEGGEWEVEEVECINDGSDKCAIEARRKGK
ncbi:MAG: V4R domain-containing protein [Conexivisphaera sp.]